MGKTKKPPVVLHECRYKDEVIEKLKTKDWEDSDGVYLDQAHAVLFLHNKDPVSKLIPFLPEYETAEFFTLLNAPYKEWRHVKVTPYNKDYGLNPSFIIELIRILYGGFSAKIMGEVIIGFLSTTNPIIAFVPYKDDCAVFIIAQALTPDGLEETEIYGERYELDYTIGDKPTYYDLERQIFGFCVEDKIISMDEYQEQVRAKIKPPKEIPEKVKIEEKVKVRVLEDIPPFMGTDGEIYKLNKGDIVDLPKTNADVLCERGVVERFVVPTLKFTQEILPQLWCSRNKEEIIETIPKIESVKNEDFLKPFGGLWTSTYTPNEKYCSDWMEWCAREKPEWLTGNCYICHPKEEATVYVIENYMDLVNLYKNGFGIKATYSDKIFPDYEKLSKVCDGLMVTGKGQRETKFRRVPFEYDLYGWDCESTIWFRDVFEKVVSVRSLYFEGEKITCRLDEEGENEVEEPVPEKVKIHGILKTRYRCPICYRAAPGNFCMVHSDVEAIDLLVADEPVKEAVIDLTFLDLFKTKHPEKKRWTFEELYEAIGIDIDYAPEFLAKPRRPETYAQYYARELGVEIEEIKPPEVVKPPVEERTETQETVYEYFKKEIAETGVEAYQRGYLDAIHREIGREFTVDHLLLVDSEELYTLMDLKREELEDELKRRLTPVPTEVEKLAETEKLEILRKMRKYKRVTAEVPELKIGATVKMNDKEGILVDVSANKYRVNWDDGTWDWILKKDSEVVIVY